MTKCLFHLKDVQINGHVILDYVTVYQQTIDYKFNFLSDIIAVAIDEYCWWHKKLIESTIFLMQFIMFWKVQIIWTENQNCPLFEKKKIFQLIFVTKVITICVVMHSVRCMSKMWFHKNQHLVCFVRQLTDESFFPLWALNFGGFFTCH